MKEVKKNQQFWEVLLLIELGETQKKNMFLQIGTKVILRTLLYNRNYFFSDKKCGKEGCYVCKPFCIPKEELIKSSAF